ncbi:MAG: OmpA family protein [Bacteroidetes bacterium]|jgi:OOP family OmpA-OmpF porin|nr:OmpA family protein [Bacteroidota bacterium]
MIHTSTRLWHRFSMRKSGPWFLLAMFFSCQALIAQTSDKKWNLGLMAGFSVYNGDLGNSISDFRYTSIRENPTGGINFSRYLTRSFDLSLNASYGSFGYYEDGVTIFKGAMAHANLNVRYKFNNGYMLAEASKVAPYLFVGGGVSNFTGDRINNGYDYPIVGGAGLRFRILPKITLNYQATIGQFTSAHYNPQTSNNATGNDKFMLHMLGIGLDLGKAYDADKDGVIDSKDKCPNTPSTVKVDQNACPLDKDGDGVYDYEDTCPELAGPASSKGCPDRDNDGVLDANDECPDVSGIAAFNGCPDSDKDGVYDDIDLCINIAGSPLNNGCPVVDEKVKQLFQKALQGIRFETGKAKIMPVSFPILDAIVQVMSDHPDYKLNISGHTDNVGDDAMNMTLSKDRAASVSNYLITKGVSPMRVSSAGYGESKPVDTNDSENGRTRNRRVEFQVEFLQ